MRRYAVNPASVLPRLVDVFSHFEADPSANGAVWKLAEGVNRSVVSLGPNLRHFVSAEGGYIGFNTCRQKHGLIGHSGSQWIYREGSGRPRKGDMEDALTFLTSALTCAAAGAATGPADAYLEAVYRHGEPTAEPNELVMFGNALLSLEKLDNDSVYLNYIYLPPEARGSGAGSKTLQLITDLADDFCVTLSLQARSFRITDPYSRELDKSPGDNLVATEALVRLYSRFGFTGSAKFMERVPECQLARAASYRTANGTVHDLTHTYLTKMQRADYVRVFHGTSFGSDNNVHRPQDMVHGIDARGTAVSHHSTHHHTYRGLFVAPTYDGARDFGKVVFEFAVKAEMLHSTDYAGGYSKSRARSGLCEDTYAGSFDPELSCSLAQSSGEPQALFIGVVPKERILAIYVDDQKMSPDEFIDHHGETLTHGRNPVDLRSPRLSLEQYLDGWARSSGADRETLEGASKYLLSVLERDGEDYAVAALMDEAQFSETSARKFLHLLKARGEA